MKIAALRERTKGEERTAISPETTKLYTKMGFSVFVEKNIGAAAGYTDKDYLDAGAKVSGVPLEICSDADIILKVQPTPLVDEINEIDMAKAGAIIIGMLSPYSESNYIKRLLDKKLTSFAMELVPRITKAQVMDALSSQTNLAGYRAVIEAAYHFNKALPMMMTAAGTITPAKILILGAGVAGLQAIATAKRLGGAVFAYDVRKAAKEQIESLGGKFVYPQQRPAADMEDKSGYAKEGSADEKAMQEDFLASIIKGYDIVITTAQIPGRPAPLLITSAMVDLMKPGSVIVDLATSTGGNVEGSNLDEIVTTTNNVKILGYSNLASKVSMDSSKLYAKNLYNFVSHAFAKNEIDFSDEIVSKMLLTKDGINKL
jgi:NAD(P) transhydrogenase subunit alpha